MSTLEVWTGRPFPLGATVTKDDVNFAIFSENATEVPICLFDDPAAPAETLRVRIRTVASATAPAEDSRKKEQDGIRGG